MQAKKGFTLIESLFVIFIMTIMLLLCTKSVYHNKNLNIQQKVSSYIYQTQTTAMVNKERQDLGIAKLHFNENGNINKAATVKIGNTNFVFQLGAGRFYYA